MAAWGYFRGIAVTTLCALAVVFASQVRGHIASRVSEIVIGARVVETFSGLKIWAYEKAIPPGSPYVELLGGEELGYFAEVRGDTLTAVQRESAARLLVTAGGLLREARQRIEIPRVALRFVSDSGVAIVLLDPSAERLWIIDDHGHSLDGGYYTPNRDEWLQLLRELFGEQVEEQR